ncbi:MAG TPA: hypothetical protein DHV14_03045 [Micrococcales bacterium]|uniref:hypothetical protein n=1 Tax=Miniimonas TaxID=947525 RepID=UPI000ED2E198|nr:MULTISPECIES: hypothetical protein [Miniimonas]HCX84116.1 hypothetical protein [Micrococcales bacterium]
MTEHMAGTQPFAVGEGTPAVREAMRMVTAADATFVLAHGHHPVEEFARAVASEFGLGCEWPQQIFRTFAAMSTSLDRRGLLDVGLDVRAAPSSHFPVTLFASTRRCDTSPRAQEPLCETPEVPWSTRASPAHLGHLTHAWIETHFLARLRDEGARRGGSLLESDLRLVPSWQTPYVRADGEPHIPAMVAGTVSWLVNESMLHQWCGTSLAVERWHPASKHFRVDRSVSRDVSLRISIDLWFDSIAAIDVVDDSAHPGLWLH